MCVCVCVCVCLPQEQTFLSFLLLVTSVPSTVSDTEQVLNKHLFNKKGNEM